MVLRESLVRAKIWSDDAWKLLHAKFQGRAIAQEILCDVHDADRVQNLKIIINDYFVILIVLHKYWTYKYLPGHQAVKWIYDKYL